MRSELIEIVKEDLIKHEGYKEEIYLCTADVPTFGIGHAIKDTDPEYTWPIGTPVEKERIDNAFLEDVQIAINDVEALFEEPWTKPDKVQRVLVNMAFNIGRSRFSRFKKMREAVNNNDFKQAANEMVDSLWYAQVGNRSIELENWMRNA